MKHEHQNNTRLEIYINDVNGSRGNWCASENAVVVNRKIKKINGGGGVIYLPNPPFLSMPLLITLAIDYKPRGKIGINE